MSALVLFFLLFSIGELRHKLSECKNETPSLSGRGKSESPSSGSCQLPDPNTYNFQYELLCPEWYPEEQCKSFVNFSIAPRYSFIKLNCFDGYMLHKNHHKESFCSRNLWRPELKPCKKICEKLKPQNVNLKCTYQGRIVNCDGDLRSGTSVSAKCIPEYRPESRKNYEEITCKDDGKWDNKLLKCEPNCGVQVYTNIQPLITGGQSAEFGELPWHVAVYDNTRQSPQDLICGATIVTEYLLLSAAHCFYDDTKQEMRNPAYFEIVVGKINRNRNTTDSFVQRAYKVKEIYSQEYLGSQLRYQNDIVILEMETKIIFYPYVIPVCLVYSENASIPFNETLKVAGWGIDDHRQFSPILKTVKLTSFSLKICLKNSSHDVKAYLSDDKFCVGNGRGTGDGVASGDSGGGLSSLDILDSRHYLQAIVSLRSTSAESPLIAVTNVNHHIRWISSIIDRIHNSRFES